MTQAKAEPQQATGCTTAEFAALVRRTPATVRAWARTGKLIPILVTQSGLRIFRRSDSEKFIR
jgi:DNA-binding transcriptional MerR regulator